MLSMIDLPNTQFSDIPRIPGPLGVIFRFTEEPGNEIRSQSPLFAAKSSDRPPCSVGNRCFATIKAHSAGAVSGI
jgi:hypothetical protein